MLKNYTIEMSNKAAYKDFNLVQYTLSKYQTAAARGTFVKLANWGVKQKIVVHMDFIKTFTRFPLMRDSLKGDFISEIASILIASNKDLMEQQAPKTPKPDVLGVVIHADTPIAKAGIEDLYLNGIPKENADVQEFCKKYWSSPFFDSSKNIADELEQVFLVSEDISSFVENFYNHAFMTLMASVREFIFSYYGNIKISGKVFIENTTKVPIKNDLSFVDLLYGLTRKDSLSSMCFDEEHAYAAGEPTLLNYDTGEVNKNFLDKFNKHDLIHLNTIPEEVGKGSYLDRHSETTIFESKASPESYFNLSKELTSRNIQYVREIKVIERELVQINKYNYDRHEIGVDK